MSARLFCTIVMLLVGAASAASAPREPQQYVLLLDADGLAFAGGYWLSPDVMVSLRRDEFGAVRMRLVDRDFFPTRASHPDYLIFDAIETTPDPLALLGSGGLKVGVPQLFKVRRTAAAVGDIPSDAIESEATVELTASAALALPSGKVIEHIYTIRQQEPGKPAGEMQTHIYFPELLLDVDRQQTPALAGIAFGQATSSMDFTLLFEEKANQRSPTIDCLAAFRATPAYRAASLEYARIADAWTAANFPATGFDYVTTQGFKPFMEALQPSC